MSRAQDDGLGVLVSDGPTGRILQSRRQGRICGDQDGSDFPLLQGLLPIASELIGICELVKQLPSVKVSAAIDEDVSGRIKLPDQVAAPVVMVEHPVSGMRLKKCHRARRKELHFNLWLTLNYLGSVDTGK